MDSKAIWVDQFLENPLHFFFIFWLRIKDFDVSQVCDDYDTKWYVHCILALYTNELCVPKQNRINPFFQTLRKMPFFIQSDFTEPVKQNQ